MIFRTCLVPQMSAHSLERRGKRNNDTALAACVHYQLSQDGDSIVSDDLSKQCTFQLGCGMLSKRSQTRPSLALGDATQPIPR
jgi:hypothetical protein